MNQELYQIALLILVFALMTLGWDDFTGKSA
jgi:hypothetical protein